MHAVFKDHLALRLLRGYIFHLVVSEQLPNLLRLRNWRVRNTFIASIPTVEEVIAEGIFNFLNAIGMCAAVVLTNHLVVRAQLHLMPRVTLLHCKQRWG